MQNSQTIVRNSLWYGLELVFSLAGAFVSSIFIARVFGPERLGYFNYVVWLTNITGNIGSFGLPITTRKYMAEYLNSGRPGAARSIYRTTLLIQSLIASALFCAGLGLIFTVGDPHYRWISVLLILAVAPRMIACIPSNANNASESMRRNTGPAFAGAVLTFLLIFISLWAHWGLTGIAAAMASGPIVELVLKLRSVRRWLGGVAPEPIPAEVRSEMVRYSTQGLFLMLLNVVVWDRSDLVVLKMMNHDIRQVTFFSLAFNLAERVLMLPNAFGNSLGVTMMAQFGRGPEKLKDMTVEGARWALLIAGPLLLGMACVSGPAVLLLYGNAYRPLIPVLAVVALLAIPKSIVAAPTMLLQSTARQGFLLVCGCICGAIDIGLDFLLTPRYGAMGAALANGLAQTLAAITLWIWVYRRFGLNLRLPAFARLAIALSAVAAASLGVSRLIPTRAGVVLSVVAAAAAWFAVLRLTRALDEADGRRLLLVGRILPRQVQHLWQKAVLALTGPVPDVVAAGRG